MRSLRSWSKPASRDTSPPRGATRSDAFGRPYSSMAADPSVWCSTPALRIRRSPPVTLRGVTGSATVPTIRVDTLSVGDVAVDSPVLPIVPDAMGGAEGILGSEGLTNKRIFIDFRHDRITITYSRGERAGIDFVRIPFHSLRGQLIVVDAKVGSVRVKAIIDTGGQTTVANLALRDALGHRAGRGRPDQIIGATMVAEDGEIIATPAIELGTIKMLDPGVTFADLYIFKQWK